MNININERDLKDLHVFLQAIRDAVEGEVRDNLKARFRGYSDDIRGYAESQLDEEVDEIVHSILEGIASDAVIRYRQTTDATDEE